jgi:3',5'-cyclic AMP phosphodiesterase CpdA
MPASFCRARSLLDRLPVPWHAVPGNHDVGDNPMTGHGNGSTINSARHQRWLETIGPDRWALDRGGWTLIALNAQVFGSGLDADTAQWTWLSDRLDAIPVGHPMVLVMHKPVPASDHVELNANVEALVYVDAFIPDVGQTLGGLSAAGSCLDPATAFNAVPSAGGVVDLYLRVEANPPYPGFAECFANGVTRTQAAVLAAVQRPAAVAQLGEPSGPPAWETIPAWALIGTADRVITPAQQEAMATNARAQISTVDAGHLSLVSRPNAVTEIIQTAVDAVM